VHEREVSAYFDGTASEPKAALLAVDGDEVVGFAELSIRPCAEGCTTTNVAYLEGWYVRPEWRKAGIGRALVAASEEWAREQGCTEFASDTRFGNDTSIQAHRACGFSEVADVKCFRKMLDS